MEALHQTIDDIRAGIRAGRYPNESAVSQGVVMRLLAALGWDTYDTRAVWPEYSAGGGRVDFALCHPPGKPLLLIEVKPIGKGDGNEGQLFRYAFDIGAPLLVLTDGQGWSVFLPSGQGDYAERQVYKIDLLEQDAGEAAGRLARYLGYGAATSGQARLCAQQDYESKARGREMERTLPQAWARLLTSGDEAIVAALAREVEDICRYRPDADMVEAFLAGQASHTPPPALLGWTPAHAPALHGAPAYSPPLKRERIPTSPPLKREPIPTSPPLKRGGLGGGPAATTGHIGFTLHGQFTPTKSAIQALIGLFEALQAADPTFHERFAALPKHGRTRRYLALDRNKLYQDPALARYAKQLKSGYWLPTNMSTQAIGSVAKLSCQVMNLTYGRDVILHLGEA
jgi:predicted type IV restriction endonuclease